MVVSLLLSPPVSPSPAKHSLEGQRRDVQLVPARLHAEAGATCMWPGTNTPFVAPRPCFLLIRPTDRRRHGDSKLGGSSGRAAWGLGRRGGAGSFRLGAGLGAPHLCAGPAWQERSECRRLEPQVPPPPREGRRGCRVPGPWTARWER